MPRIIKSTSCIPFLVALFSLSSCAQDTEQDSVTSRESSSTETSSIESTSPDSAATKSALTDRSGDGKGLASVQIAGETIELVGECSDWAFRMTEGNPRLNVEAGLDGYEKAFVYNGSASLQRNGAWWYVVEPVEVTSMEDGYTVSATAKNMQSTDGEATDILIRVTCE